MAIYQILIFAVFFMWIYHHYKNRKFWKKINKINGYPTLPLIGNIHQIKSDAHGRFVDTIKMWKDFGYKTFKLKVAWSAYVYISTPECIEVLLKSGSNLDKPSDYFMFKAWLGEGLLISTGNKWRQQRKIITPTFHFKVLESYVTVFNKHGTTFVNILEKQTGRVINIDPLVARCTLDIICESAMGADINAQKDEQSDLVQAFDDITTILNRRLVEPLKRIQWFFDLTEDKNKHDKSVACIHQFSEKLITKRRDEMADEIKTVFSDSKGETSEDIYLKIKAYRPFLDLLLLSKLPDGGPLHDSIIRDEVNTFIFEGHDTIASSLCTTIYLLSKHPEIQQKALEEQRFLFRDNLLRDPTFEDISAMTYLEAVIKETLRILPVAYAIGRKMTEDLSLPDGTELPSGVTAVLFVYGLHNNPTLYPDPDKFDPGRFLNNARQDSHPFSYIPFSGGYRNCIGQKFAMMEMKALLSKLIRKFEMTDAGLNYEPIWAPQVLLKSENGINVIMNQRKL